MDNWNQMTTALMLSLQKHWVTGAPSKVLPGEPSGIVPSSALRSSKGLQPLFPPTTRATSVCSACALAAGFGDSDSEFTGLNELVLVKLDGYDCLVSILFHFVS